MKFKVPYFISNHAIDRFRQYVDDIPAADIIRLLQLRLQDPGEPVQWEIRGSMLTPIFRWFYQREGKTRICYIPVVPGEGEWPAVPTILGSNSPLHKDLSAGRAPKVFIRSNADEA